MVKERMKFLSDSCICLPEAPRCDRCYKPPGKILSRKPILASEEEVKKNPRARSAKLRIFCKN